MIEPREHRRDVISIVAEHAGRQLVKGFLINLAGKGDVKRKLALGVGVNRLYNGDGGRVDTCLCKNRIDSCNGV